MSGLWFTTLWHVCLIWSELSLSHCLSLVTLLDALSLLHFTWVVDDTKCVDAKCVLVTHVCLSVPCRIPTLLHRPGCNLAEWYGVPSSCALGRINARVSLLWQHSAEREMSASVCTRSMPGYYYELECGPMPNLMVALPNIGGALCSTPQSLADAHY